MNIVRGVSNLSKVIDISDRFKRNVETRGKCSGCSRELLDGDIKKEIHYEIGKERHIIKLCSKCVVVAEEHGVQL